MLVIYKSAAMQATVAATRCNTMRVGKNAFCTEFRSQNLVYKGLLGLTLDNEVEADR
jgi:hypothetical protein